MSLGRGLVYSFIQSGGTAVLWFIAGIILARLLLPEEFGVYAVALAAVTIVNALRDFGITKYIIQEQDLTRERLQSVFGVALILGWGFGLIVWFSRGFVANFYNEPELLNIMAVIAGNFALIPFGQAARSLLRREQRYREVALSNLIPAAVNACVAIPLAWMGYGAMSLAWASLAAVATSVVLSFWFMPDHLTLTPSLSEWRRVSSFGFFASAEAVLVQLGEQAPQLAMGRSLGFAEVGFFTRAARTAAMISLLFIGSITWVTGSNFAERRRAGEALRDIVLKSSDYVLVIALPALVFLAVEAQDIVALLYGPRWEPSAPILQILCIAQMMLVVPALANGVYEASGAIKLKLRNEMILQSLSVALVVTAIPFGLLGVAWSRVALAAAALTLHMTVLRRHAETGFADLLSSSARTGLVTIGFAGALLALHWLLPASMLGKPTTPILLGGIMGLVWIVLLLAASHPLVSEVAVLRQRLLSRKPS